jgi:predicted Zn-dependent protease
MKFLRVSAACFFGFTAMTSQALTLNDEQEYYLGRSVSAYVLTSNANIDHEFNTYMTAMVRWMASFSPRPTTFIGYRVSLIDSPLPTAISAPGGYIYLSKTMLEKIESEDQLAGILAHELAHIIARHGEKTIVQKMEQDQSAANKKNRAKVATQRMQKGGEALKKFGGLLGKVGGKQAEEIAEAGEDLAERGAELEKNVDLYFDTVSGYMGDLMAKGFSKEQEYQADEIAVFLMAASGYDARELARFLSTEKPSLEKIVGQWQSTHPLDAARVERVEQKASPWEYLGNPAARNKRYEKLKAKVLSN